MQAASVASSHSSIPVSARVNGHATPLLSSIQRAVHSLHRQQKADGHWVGELQGDTILESEYVLLMAYLQRENEEVCRKAARYVLQNQLPGGGWSNYPGGPPDVTVSVKAYFALKLTGHDPRSRELQRARDVIRGLGGAERSNSFTRFYLALLGQIPYENCPAVPPEIVLLPRWLPFHLYEMSSWTRTIVVPLSIFYAHRPVRRPPPERGIAELFVEAPQKSHWPHEPTRHLVSWTNAFLLLDWLTKKLDPGTWCKPLRRWSLRRAEAWMRDHLTASDGLGAIFPPMIYTVIALRCLGVPDDAPEMRWALKQLQDLMLEENGTVRLQPCFSPVWDTALTLSALAEVNTDDPEHSSILDRGARWLLSKEVRRRGDWSIANPQVEPSGWFFEYHNAHYPDVDDTAAVLIALAKTNHDHDREGRPAIERGLRWVLAMQNNDGGWAAFDRNVNRRVLEKVPFADHNAMLDPSCADITARVLECLGSYGFGMNHPQVRKAVRYLEKTQDPRGCWMGRWGVNYVYGTWQALCGLAAVGYDAKSPIVRRAADWLTSVQQPSGAWGESCASYEDPRTAGQGPPTASQTAWAILGLLAAGAGNSDAVRAGIGYLIREQNADGAWDEEQFTGTGFPKVFYLKYHLYSLYFPLLALSRYQTTIDSRPATTKETACAFRSH